MIQFPVVRSLTLENYLLYPRSLEAPFKITFLPGPNLIVGVNGSGKTTLISAALRALTGPYEVPSATSEGQLGQVRHKPTALSRAERQVFGRRVADGAKNATITLEVGFGTDIVTIKRSLADLGMISALENGKPVELAPLGGDTIEDQAYHRFINGKLGVGSFFDALIIIRYLVFMMEDRRALVWDQYAQRQIYRILLLSLTKAADYATVQEELISADSALRNAQHLITRQKTERTKAAQRVKTVAEAEGQKIVKMAEITGIRDHLDSLARGRLEADQDRKRARLDRLRAVETKDGQSRELERIKLEALGHWLTPSKETAKYILGQLLSDQHCLVCGTNPSPLAAVLEQRFKEEACPICGAIHAFDGNVTHMAEIDRVRIVELEEVISFADLQISEAEGRLNEAQRRLQLADAAYEEKELELFEHDRELIAILRKIPADRAAILTSDNEIEALENIVKKEKQRRKEAEQRFEKLVAEAVKQVTGIQNKLNQEFTRYTSLFIKEEAKLVYQTVQGRVGQGGGAAKFGFPLFRLAMSGGATAGMTVREQPDQVSQSQAEFVDLAFRMALMSVIAGSGSLVIDAPEASLDFLFAERAGSQLSAFSYATTANRVIATSYLPSEHFVCSFLAKAKTPKEREERIVDLISHAAENAAIRADKPRYAKFLKEIIDGKLPV